MSDFYKNLNAFRDFKKCRGKNCYEKKSALSALHFREKAGVKHLRIYHCTLCNMWHLTHKEKFYE